MVSSVKPDCDIVIRLQSQYQMSKLTCVIKYENVVHLEGDIKIHSTRFINNCLNRLQE